MTQRNKTWSVMVAAALAGGSFCYGQQAERSAAGAPAPAGHAEHAAMADPKQVDQQVDQQLMKIEQQTDGTAGDRAFVLEAGLGGHFEVAAGRLAMEKSQDAGVKRVAQTIVQDHEQANAKLMPIAQKLQVEVPMGLTSMKQHKLNLLKSLDSREFDQAYLACMDEAHAHDVHAFRNKSQLAKSPEVKQFAAQTLPKLQEHHQLIRQTGAGLGLPTGMDAQPAGARMPADAPPAGGAVNPTDGTQRNPSPAAPENRPNAGRPPSAANVPSQPK